MDLVLELVTHHVDWDTKHRTLVKCVVRCGDLGEIHFLRAEANCNSAFKVMAVESGGISGFRNRLASFCCFCFIH